MRGMYITDVAQNHEEVNNIHQTMKILITPGNFMYSPDGEKTASSPEMF